MYAIRSYYGGVGNKRQILIAGMTGRTIVMLLVVSRIGKGRVSNRLSMTILARGGQGHTVGGVMIDVMGKEVKRRTVINVAVALGTVAGGPAVLQRSVSVMTYRTGIMLDVVSSIHKGLARGHCRRMTGVA